MHDVTFLVFDGVKLLDVSGPAEVFTEANRHGATYRVRYVSPGGDPVTTSVRATLPVDGDALADPAAGGAGTLVVAGGDRLVGAPIEPDLRDSASRLAAAAGRVASVCTGAFVLAAAGLLDGRRATTHWRHADLLSRVHPGVDVQPDAIYVADGSVYTSAGVSAGIDLALALVEADHGPEVARAVARGLVVYMQRPGGQSQFSAPLRVPVPRRPALRAAVDAVVADPAGDHSLAALASVASVSQRHLGRLFAAELHTSPARFVEQQRLEAAKSLLDAGHTVTEAARLSGFGSPETLRRGFTRRFGIPPSRYRRHFATTRRQG
ncbi:GlxA family transcriptional regulator [Jiangella rhizosphaerae]|uniref:Helix-turn-helix domain-containing protein n=1 Tax=Jiangella rhizosphaerae TaxID=2293569 RepID=A0A418KVA7_9ACTN|nr:DJ-1/PfpI family protein [Jiangella rhizosphaerae]RIQ33662.1 helix-turn-helix domain-containing protein [Jiangella rhizosphaerae]